MEQSEKTSIQASKQRAYHRAWYQRNRAREIERVTKYHREHPETCKRIYDRHKEKHPEANYKAVSKWRKEHPEAWAKMQRDYYHRIQDEACYHHNLIDFLRGYRIKKALQDCKEIVEI